MGETPGGQPTSVSPPFAGPEQRAREFLAQGKWRKARDELKPLVKIDRAKFLPLLIEANSGLAREMLGKGQVAEAQQVLVYLKTLAPAEQLRGLELEFASRSGPGEDFDAKFGGALADPSARLPESEKVAIADQMVLAFRPPAAGDSALGSVAAEVRAVQEALEAVSSEQWERVPQLLRVIPHRSPFSHWAVFVKGLAAFFTGDAERASRFFSNLPSGSVPARASEAYRALANGRDSEQRAELSEWTIDHICRLTRQPLIGRLLSRAERLWKEGKYAESYRVFRDAVTQFPTNSPDLLGALSEFYFQAPYQMWEVERDKYFSLFDRLLQRHAAKNTVEEMLMYRLFALAEGHFTDTWTFRADWEAFLRARERLYQRNERFESIAYGWLGEKLAEPEPSPYRTLFERPAQMRDATGARECLKKAIQLDPNNLQAHLLLCKVHTALGENAERNRLLDEMARRFPEEKQVFIEAAQHCVERKAYKKALDFLGRARQLDRLDPQIPEMIVVTRRQLARQYFQQKQADKGRQAWEAVEELLVDKPDNFHRSRWTAQLRQGVLEQLFGDPARGDTLLAQARATSPSLAAFLLFAHLTHRVYAQQSKAQSPFVSELRTELKRNPSASRAAMLLRIFAYWEAAPDKPFLGREADWLRQHLVAAAKRGSTRAEAKEIVELTGPGPFEEAAGAFIKTMLRQDPHDPCFRLFDYLLRMTWIANPADSRLTLQSILEEARRRGDQEAIQKAQRLLYSLDHPPPLPPFPGPEFQEEEFEEGPFEALPEMPEGAEEGLREMLELLAGASESDIRQFRKTLPKDMPDFIFDMLVDAAKGRGPMPPPPPLPGPRAKRKFSSGPPGDGNQMDLF